MLAKAILVLMYFLLIFLVAKVLDLSANWLELSCVASPLFNPLAVSVRKLKRLLDERGVSYVGVVDKTELAQLVEESGSFCSNCNCSDVNGSQEDDDDEVTYFHSSSHFFEKIEDTKASGWLVKIIPDYRGSLLSLKQWRRLSKKMTLLGIKAGVFDCGLDPRLCAKNGWDAKCLLLSSPVGHHAKGNVKIHIYSSKPSVERAFSWINSILGKRVRKLKNPKEYSQYLASKEKSNYEMTKLVFFGQLDEPPALLSSLSIKFMGRVNFAYFKVTKNNADKILGEHGSKRFCRLLVITPEGQLSYGTMKGEFIQYRSLETFLTCLHPEVNEAFLLTIILVNQICILELFLTSGGILRKMVKFFMFFVFANTALMIIWLPIVKVYRLDIAQPLINISLRICRFITTSNLLSPVRYYFLSYSKWSLWFLSFCLYGFGLNRLKRKIKYLDNDDSTDWFYEDLMYFSRFFNSFGTTMVFPSSLRLNEGTSFLHAYEDMLIQRLATPNLWLQPLLPTDFVRDLPVWKNCECARPSDSRFSQKTKAACDANFCKWLKRPDKIIISEECSICLGAYRKNCIMVSLPCKHVFHQLCLEKWFKSEHQLNNLNCPVCRWPAYKAKASTHDFPTANGNS